MALVWWLAAGCAGPTMQVRTTPAHSLIQVDAQPRGHGEVEQSLPYYGTVRVTAISADPPGASERQPGWRTRHAMVPIEPPASPWLFPLDFLIEFATHPWRATTLPIVLELEQRSPLAMGEEPADSDELRRRAARVRTVR